MIASVETTKVEDMNHEQINWCDGSRHSRLPEWPSHKTRPPPRTLPIQCLCNFKT